MKSYRDYFYPGTFTLQNNLGIRDPDVLALAEAQFTRARMRQPIDAMELTPDGLRTIHHHVFQDVYPWAGQFRTVDMIKVTEDRGPNVEFARGATLNRVEMPRFFGELRYDVEIGRAFDSLDRETFAYRAAVYIADLNYIHPFPEGNGRTQRLFLEQLADRAGYRIDHIRIDRNTWMEASIDSYGQDQRRRDGSLASYGPHTKMTACIAGALEAGRNKDRDRSTDQINRADRGDVGRKPDNRDVEDPRQAQYRDSDGRER